SSETVKTVNSGARYPQSMLSITMPGPERGKHPTQKPVALMEWLIRTYSNEGETVLDNVMGSGTTGVACVKTGRRFVGMEANADYFQVASRRIEAALDSAGMQVSCG